MLISTVISVSPLPLRRRNTVLGNVVLSRKRPQMLLRPDLSAMESYSEKGLPEPAPNPHLKQATDPSHQEISEANQCFPGLGPSSICYWTVDVGLRTLQQSPVQGAEVDLIQDRGERHFSKS